MVDIENLLHFLQKRNENEEEIKKILSRTKPIEKEEAKRLWQITKETFPNEPEPERRKLFIMSFSLIFAPGIMTGKRTKLGIRKMIKEITECQSAPTISINCRNIYFIYNTYKNIKNKVHEIVQKYEKEKK